MNELQAAQARKANADTDIAYLDAGVIQVSQIQRNLQALESYQFDGAKIEELEGNEDVGMFNEPVEEPQEEPKP
jgi:hypothetical protein